jgi:hypothetical protein
MVQYEAVMLVRGISVRHIVREGEMLGCRQIDGESMLTDIIMLSLPVEEAKVEWPLKRMRQNRRYRALGM